MIWFWLTGEPLHSGLHDWLWMVMWLKLVQSPCWLDRLSSFWITGLLERELEPCTVGENRSLHEAGDGDIEPYI